MITINHLEPTFATFPDGEVNVTFQPSLVESLDSEVAIDWRFRNNDEIIKLGLILNLLDTYDNIETVNVHIPFMPYSRMDRHEAGYHNPMSLAVMMSILKAYDEQVSFDVHYSTNDIHNPAALLDISSQNGMPAYFKNHQVMSKYLFAFMEAHSALSKEVLVVFPDKGALARYDQPNANRINDDSVVSMLKRTTDGQPNIMIGQKTRDFETHKITGYELPDEIPAGIKEIVIIDDVISYGGTFIKLIDAIRAKTDLPISIITSHAEDALWRGDLLAKEVPIYTTQSLNDHANYSPIDPVAFFNEFLIDHMM